ncbi:MAG: hypothetical protein ACFFCF_10805 [Promethearchaeota archaeon]
MTRRQSMNWSTSKRWALFLLTIFVAAGFYFGFHVNIVPVETQANPAPVTSPSNLTGSNPIFSSDVDRTQEMLSLRLATWFLNNITETWFQCILLALACLCILLILMATSLAILPQH